MKKAIIDQLVYSTIRIECEYKDGTAGTGTGFFFAFKEKDDTCVPVLITNKHVIENSIIGSLVFTKANPAGIPIDTEHMIFNIHKFETYWKKHPDPEVDLCAMAIGPFIADAEKKGNRYYYLPLLTEYIPSDSQLRNLTTLEEITMIGYPNGLWDEYNNKPILRKGITATHIACEYNGRKEFLIDAACFPGSSGSPVFIINEGMYFDKKTNIVHSNDRILLIGVLYAGPVQSLDGEIKIIEVPTIQKPIAISHLPINLGLVISAKRIKELEEMF